MTGRSASPAATHGPGAPDVAGPRDGRRGLRALLVLAAVAAALVVVPGFTRTSSPGSAPARLAWWTPSAHSDVVLHLWAASSCEQEDGWLTTRTALDRVTVEEGADEILVTAHLAAEALRSSELRGCTSAPQPIAVDVRLAEPLGDRLVLDGRCRPAAPPVGPGEHPSACP